MKIGVPYLKVINLIGKRIESLTGSNLSTRNKVWVSRIVNMSSNSGAITARNYDYQHRYFAYLILQMLDGKIVKVICEQEEDIEIVTDEDNRILIQQTTKNDYLNPFSSYDRKVIKSIANFYKIYNRGEEIKSFWFVSNCGIKGMSTSEPSTFSHLYTNHEELAKKVSDYLNENIDIDSFKEFLLILEARKLDFDKIEIEARKLLFTKYQELNNEECELIFDKIHKLAKQKCSEVDISKTVTDAALEPNYGEKKNENGLKLRSITKGDLEKELNEIVEKIKSNSVKFRQVEKTFKEEVQRLNLSTVGFKIVTPLTKFNEGNKECWKDGFFTEEDVKSNYDARRQVTDTITDLLNNKRRSTKGTIIFGDGYFGKTVLLQRIMLELIHDDYCVIYAKKLNGSEYLLNELFNKISAEYNKILIIVDDVHKQENEVIFQVVTSLTSPNVSFLLACRDKELDKLKPEIKRAQRYLDSHYLNFTQQDAIGFLNKIGSIYSNSNLQTENLETVAINMYNFSKRDPVTFICAIRSILTDVSTESETISLSVSVDIIKDCVRSDVQNQISRLDNLKKNAENLWRPFLLVSILGMFGIALNAEKNKTLLNCCQVVLHQLDSLATHGFIMKDQLNNFVPFHEMRSEELLTSLYHDKFADDEFSFNNEYEIVKILQCIYKFISSFEITTMIRRCILLNNDKRTQPLSKLIAENLIDINESDSTIKGKSLSELFCYGIARYYSGLGRLKEAMKYYDKSIEIDPHRASYYSQKGLALDNNGKHKEAVTVYEKGLEINPKNADLWYNKGIALFNLYKFDQSINAFDKALSIEPNDVDAINNKGRSLLRSGKIELALKQFEKALLIDSDYYYALVNKASVLMSLRQFDNALVIIESAIRINSSDAKSWFVKGLILYENERYQEALDALEETIRLNPTIADYWYVKAQCLHTVKKYEEAIKSYKQTLRLNPKLYTAISDMGNSYLSLGKGKEAVNAFDQALGFRPNDPIIWYNKALTYFKMGNLLESIRFASKATDLAPKYVSDWMLQMASHHGLGNDMEIRNISRKLKDIKKQEAFEQTYVNTHDPVYPIFSSRS